MTKLSRVPPETRTFAWISTQSDRSEVPPEFVPSPQRKPAYMRHWTSLHCRNFRCASTLALEIRFPLQTN